MDEKTEKRSLINCYENLDKSTYDLNDIKTFVKII
jgi:hypothetical protein